MPLALLLSPDDQAVAAITAVLEEMSVTCERPLDGASAAQKLNSNRFDLVLVDCENLAAAKLIFDVCRHRKGGSHPVPVAVVDGRAGLPTAFRLGAELILTKPVSKDQARVTIRTAISRVKREESMHTDGVSVTENANQTTNALETFVATAQPSIEQPADDAADYVAPEGRAFAAAASTGTPSLTSFSDPVPSSSVPTVSMTMSAAVAEPEPVEAAPATDLPSAKGAVSAEAAPHPASSLFASAEPVAAEPEESKVAAKITAAVKSDSEVKAEAKSQPVVSATVQSDAKFSPSEQEIQKSEAKQGHKSHGRLVTLLVFLVACGGLYAAWTYEPGFQALVKSQINHILVVLGVAPQPQQHPAPVPVKPTTQTSKPSAGVLVQTVTPDASHLSQPRATDPNAVPGAISAPAVSPASSSPDTTTHPASSTTAQQNPAAASPSASTTTTRPVATPMTKPGVTRIDLSPAAVAEPAKHAPASSAPKPPPQH